MPRDVMQVMHSLGQGGIETWIMNLFRRSVWFRERCSVCVTGPAPELKWEYESALGEMNVPVYRARFSFSGAPFVWRLGRLVGKEKVRVVHAHLNYLSGFATAAAVVGRAELRIAHYHTTLPPQHRTPLRMGYIRGARSLEAGTATHVLQCASGVVSSFGAAGARPQVQTLYCGIDTEPYRMPVDRAATRAALGIPEGASVFGHVGSFTAIKNQTFLLDVLAAYIRRYGSAWLILVGDGPLRNEVMRKASRLGLQERVRFLGQRQDVPRLLAGAMDVFLFPSLFEGLPLSCLEAQAAGLRLVVADRVTSEVEVCGESIARLSLADGPYTWAQACRAAALAQAANPRLNGATRVQESPFGLEQGLKALRELYDGAKQTREAKT